jgi:AcrR family transcriptional regulator
MLTPGRLHMGLEGLHEPGGASVPRRRGRPRSGSAERAILDAGARLLAERGVQRTSMEAIAVAARVSKATIYRRWPSKDALILDLIAVAAEQAAEQAVEDAAGDDVVALPEQDCRADLLAWVRSGLEAGRRPEGAALLHLLRRAAEDPSLAANLVRRVLIGHRARFAAIVERGTRSGQLRPHLDAGMLLHLLSGPVLYRHLLEPAAPAGDAAEQARTIVDLVWPGIRAE